MGTKENTLFIAFVRQYQAGLRSYIRSLGVNNASVDDIAQESFLVAYNKMDEFDYSEDFGYWLRGISRNLIRNELSKNARHSRLLNNELTLFLLDELKLSYQTPKYDEDEVKALSDCLNKLPEKSRHMVVGKYKKEQDNSVLAKLNAMSETAVRISLMRIRNQLKSCINLRLGHTNE